MNLHASRLPNTGWAQTGISEMSRDSWTVNGKFRLNKRRVSNGDIAMTGGALEHGQSICGFVRTWPQGNVFRRAKLSKEPLTWSRRVWGPTRCPPLNCVTGVTHPESPLQHFQFVPCTRHREWQGVAKHLKHCWRTDWSWSEKRSALDI